MQEVKEHKLAVEDLKSMQTQHQQLLTAVEVCSHDRSLICDVQ